MLENLRTGLSVSSADFIRNIGHWQTEALTRPISITHHGRERLVLVSYEQFRSIADGAGGRDGSASGISALHEALLANLDQGYLLFSRSLTIVASNQAARAFFGLTANDLHALTADALFSEHLNGAVRNALKRVARTRVAESIEAVLDDKRVLMLRAFPAPDGVALLFTNISEQLVIEMERAESAAVRSSLSAFPDMGEIHLDVRGRITRVDGAFARALGFCVDQLLEHRISDLVDSAARRTMNAAVEAMLADRTPQFLDVTFISRMGEPVESRIAMTPLFHQHTPLGALCLAALVGCP